MESITIAKLNEYRRFGGDDDGISIMVPPNMRETNPKEWYLIRSLIQDIKLVERGLASDEYSKRLNNDLIKYCDSEVTIAEIKKIADFL